MNSAERHHPRQAALPLVLLACACASPTPAPAGPDPVVVVPVMPEETGTGQPTQPAPLEMAASDCTQAALIDDGEDGNNQIRVADGRGGYWYTYVDNAGSTIVPEAGSRGGVFAMTPGGTEGSRAAARMQGSLAAGSTVYAGMGLNFVDPKGAYDASAYSGVSFLARCGSGSCRVRLKLPDVNTDPEGGVCEACYNDFGMDLELSSDWKWIAISFRALEQEPGWGAPRPAHVTRGRVYGLIWQAMAANAPFDIWVDDIWFSRC